MFNAILSNFAFNIPRDMAVQRTAAYKQGQEKHHFLINNKSSCFSHQEKKIPRADGMHLWAQLLRRLSRVSLSPGVWHFRTLTSPNSTVVSACLYSSILEGWGRKIVVSLRPPWPTYWVRGQPLQNETMSQKAICILLCLLQSQKLGHIFSYKIFIAGDR